MGDVLYGLLARTGRFVRKRHYRLYRAFVDNRATHRMIARLFSGRRTSVRTPEGLAMVVNPVYHGQFRSPEAVSEYEPALQSLFRALAQPGMVVYDVGANVGLFSLLFAARVGPEGRVYAFEPEENNTACLEETVKKNGLTNLEILAICVADRPGRLRFDHRGGAFSGRIADEGVSSRIHDVSEKEVVSIDAFVSAGSNRPPDLVKIDVEGFEDRVVKGALETLARDRPTLVIEIHRGLCPAIPELFELLSAQGYVCRDADAYAFGNRAILESLDGTHHVIATHRDRPLPAQTPLDRG